MTKMESPSLHHVDQNHNKRKMNHRHIVLGCNVLALLSVVFILQGCGSGDRSAGMQFSRPVPSVEAVQARFGTLPLEERLSGIVRSANQVEIYPRINAPIEEVFVENGDRVAAGDPLVRLESVNYEERLEQAKANLRISEARALQAEARLNEARNQFRRQTTIYERNLGTEVEYEAAQAQLQSAEADYQLALAQVDQARSALNEMDQELSRTIVRSPVDGVVGARSAEVGMQATTANRLFLVGDVNSFKVEVNLTENMLRYIQVGQTVRIFSETIGDTLIYGNLTRISPFLSQGSFSTVAEIELSDRSGSLLPGMFVTVDILYGESEQATLVPVSAVYRHPRTGEEGIYVAPGFGTEVEPVTDVDENAPPVLSEPVELEFRPVRVVAKGRESVGVVGVNSGDWVVTVGQSLMVGSMDNRARIRAVTWDRILAMQRTLPQDLLREVLGMEESGGS